MTTTPRFRAFGRPRSGGALVIGTAAFAALVGGAIAAAGFLTSSPAGWGALAGAAVTAFVFTFGTLTVHLVATLLPSAAMLVALLTYTLQVVLVLVIFLGLQRADMIGDELAPAWLAAGVIGVTVAWTIGQLVLFSRARIPAFEVSER
jgi:ATP synthase protein I